MSPCKTKLLKKVKMAIPDQTIIKYSKFKVLWITTMMLVVLFGVVSIIKGGSILKYVMAVVCVLTGSLIVWMEFPMVMSLNKPRLIIGNKGITDSEGQFYQWEVITGEKIVSVGSYKPTYSLQFKTTESVRKLHLGGLNYTPQQIMELIKKYRERGRLA